MTNYMKYLYLIFILLLFHACMGITDTSKYPRHVGDIPFDSQLDDVNFEPCNEKKALTHYRFGDPDLYEGEKYMIVHEFDNLVLPEMDSLQSGYITIRFMVNCNGQTGRFRVEQLDFDYKDMRFNEAFLNSILAKTVSLNGWIPAIRYNKPHDYYKYLTFKIIDNKIVDILP